MSDIVAQSVTSQLVEVMKTMINEKKSSTSVSHNHTNEEHSVTSTSKSQKCNNNIKSKNGVKPQSLSLRSTTTDMLNALPHISPKNKQISSTHDNSHELNTSRQ